MTTAATAFPETLAGRVERRMTELGISQAEVARRGRFNRAFISDLLVGRKTKLRDQNYMRLAQALLTTPQYLRWGTPPTADEIALLGAQGLLPVPSSGEMPISPEDLEALDRAFREPPGAPSYRIDPVAEARRPSGWGRTPAIPLFRSEGRYDGAAVMRNPAAEMVRGPYVSSTEDWYAIAIADSTMGPRYEAGDYVYAAQNTMVRSKDFVVVRVAGRIGKTPVQLGFVRQLLRRTADEIVVRQLNPNVETVIRQSALLGIDRIVLSGEIVGETDR